MNRRWPTLTTWSLLAATATSAILSVLTDVPRVITAALAAPTGFVWLCQRRYVQHALGGAVLAGAFLGGFTAPDGPLMAIFTEGMIVCGIMAGCRGVAERALRGRPNADGVRVLWLSSAIFGASMLPYFRGRVDGDHWEASIWRLIALPLASALVAALAQFVASIYLVKTIPEAKQDERPAIALWLVLMGCSLFAPAR